MCRIKLVLLVFLVFLLFLPVTAKTENEKIDKEVYSALDKQTDVPVIINVKEDSGIFFRTNNLEEVKQIIDKSEREQGDLIVARVSGEEIEQLEKSNAVENIDYSPVFRAFLQDSAVIVNATKTWGLQQTNLNITGNGETICVIDTGINFSHSDLIGKNQTCVIDCYNKACAENCSISDDNGHGTHVAGIAAASGGINGVAKGAGIIGLKVLDSSGNSHPTNGAVDIANAINWCINKRSEYNISVISMSLGTTTLYTNYCDSSYTSTLTKSINNATLYNISVVAATGNTGNSTGISSPACITNSTPVSSTDKSDLISSFSDRNSLVKLMAPGGASANTGSCSAILTDANRICSTYNNGAYISMSGTSMAAPHVAGAVAVINQFLSLTSQTKTPKEIEAILNNTGKKITDTTGLNFSRINLYSAIISLDNSAPNVSLISPLNNQLNMSQNQSFFCNATDLALKNATFYLWNSSSSIINQTSLLINGSSYSYNINLTNLSYGTYKWNCLFYDENSNSAFSTGNFTITIGGISTTLISPPNNNYTNVNLTNFTCQSSSETSYSLTNTTFYLWNSSSLVYNETKNSSGTTNTTIFNYTFLYESSFLWSCLSVNNASNSSLAGNYTITYDITKPNITLIEPYPADETSSSAAKIFYYNASDNLNISKCDLIANNVVVAGNSTAITNSTNNISYSFSSGTYSWQINCSDIAGNQENSSSHSFTITAPAQQISASSGGGGGGGASSGMTYTLTLSQVSSGYTKDLGKSDKVKFTIFDEKLEEHTLTVDYVASNYANLTLQSNLIKIVLGIGQSIKLNLTSSDYYDLYIKLDSISNNKATLTIQTIHETIPKNVLDGKSTGGEINVSVDKENEKPEINNIKLINYYYIGLYILMILIVLGLGYALFKKFRKGIKVKFELKIKK